MMLQKVRSSPTIQHVPLSKLVLDVTTRNPGTEPDETFTYVDLSAVNQERKAITGARSLVGGEAPSRARQVICTDDVLVSTVRPNLNGVALVPEDYDAAVASTGFCVLRPNKKLLDPLFLFHWVRSSAFVAEMVRRATGASYPAVTDRIVQQSSIPLPPLPEQSRIAVILDQADALRTKRREVLAKLDEMVQATFLTMFGDPVTNPLDWNDALLLGEVTDIVSGITKGREVNGEALREVPYLAVSNVQDQHLNLTVVKTIEATEREIERYKLKKDDLVITEGGDPDKLGRGVLWNDELEECIHQNHIFRIRLTSDELHPIFLAWLVGSQRGKRYFFRAAKQTTGIASINMSQLRAFPLLVPPKKIQKNFVSAVQRFDLVRGQLKEAFERHEALFSSLQHRAFSGDL